MQTITGKLVQFLPQVEGDSQRGHWVRGGFIIEYGDDRYPRKAAFSLLGEERCQQYYGIPTGTPVWVDFQPESREFNGKWYTELHCSKITPVTSQM